MQRLRSQYEQSIAPHLIAQTQKSQNEQSSVRDKIMSQLEEDLKHFVDLYESAPEGKHIVCNSSITYLSITHFMHFTVKSLRMTEDVFNKTEKQSKMIKTQIQSAQDRNVAIDSSLKTSERTFIITMIQIAIKERETIQKVIPPLMVSTYL